MLDLTLAFAHHLVIFVAFGTLFGEMVGLGGSLTMASIAQVARLDSVYGISATLILIVGFGRAIFAAKGWGYYSHNGFFWAKIVTFALIGLLSIGPTIALIRWKKSANLPDAVALKRIRRVLHIELTLFILLPLFAAAMARGYGEF